MKWYIGCSGFHYKHWKGTFYPEGLPQRKWFDFYCQHFGTLELNNTFYNFPKLSSLKKWYDDSPPEFVFSVKVPRTITHYKKLINAQERINELYDVLTNGLQEKLGPVLYQMPPNFTYSEERLERVLDNLNQSYTNVVEMRHDTWWRTDVHEKLGSNQIAFCGMSHPSLPKQVVKNHSTIYYRLHGAEQLYSSRYTPDELKNIAEEIKGAGAEQAFIYFNNDIGTSAVWNAKELMAIV